MTPGLLMRAAVEKKPPLKYFMLTMQKRQDKKLQTVFPCILLPPIKTLAMRKDNIRKTKTDKVDTFPIAKTLVMQDSYRFVSL